MQADEPPDAVVDVDHEIARRQRARFGQNVLRAALALRLSDEPVAENILFADDRQIGRFEALFEADDRERQRARAGGLRLMIGRDELDRLEAVLGEHMAQPLARAVAPAGDDHVQPASAQILDVRDGGVEHVGALVLPLGSEIAPDPSAAIERHAPRPDSPRKA